MSLLRYFYYVLPIQKFPKMKSRIPTTRTRLILYNSSCAWKQPFPREWLDNGYQRTYDASVINIIESEHPEYFEPWIFFQNGIHLAIHFFTQMRVVIPA